MCRDIHKGGRPPKPTSFYSAVLQEYQTMTIRQIAEAHGVARTTVSRWLKIARTGVAYGQREGTSIQ